MTQFEGSPLFPARTDPDKYKQGLAWSVLGTPRRLLHLERSEPDKIRELIGATSGRAWQAIIRTAFPKMPQKLPSENFNLFHPELGKRMVSFPQLEAVGANWGMRNLETATSLPGHPPANGALSSAPSTVRGTHSSDGLCFICGFSPDTHQPRAPQHCHRDFWRRISLPQ